LGSKNSFNTGRTVVNAAIFYTDWKDIQQQVNLPTCGFQFIGNVGAASIKGGELELKSIIVPGVTVGGVASYTKSEITSTAPGVSAQVGQPLLDTPNGRAACTSRLRCPRCQAGVRICGPTTTITDPTSATSILRPWSRWPRRDIAHPDQTRLQHAYKVGNAAIARDSVRQHS